METAYELVHAPNATEQWLKFGSKNIKLTKNYWVVR